MNAPATPVSNQSKPYKGPESYQIEDAGLFFGRDRDADQLIAKILSSRFTLVHAQSGAGKTSLLNARVIPGLESRGWSAFRILPQNDPIESVRTSTLRHILPHPEAEGQAIKRACHLLDCHQTLDELLDRYDELEVRDERRRALIAPIKLSEQNVSGASSDSGLVNPFFCRLLRSGIEIEVFSEHLSAITESAPITGETPVAQLFELLSQQSFLSAYNKLLNELNVPGRDLSVFFEHLCEVYGQRRSQFSLVLLMDQFEELFTRFIDPGVAAPEYLKGLPDWRLRYEFFEQIEGLYATKVASPIERSQESGPKAISVLPIRFVISMRNEYIANLGELRLKDNSFHLSLLERKEATEAIKEPAALFGYTYEDECFEIIIKQLTKEERFVEPAHLQLVCDKLWNEQGKEFAQLNLDENNKSQSTQMPSIQRSTLEALGGAKGILKSFFQDFVNGLDMSERMAAIELLEPLVTSGGTRNIIEREQLINAPFRDINQRRDVLDKLVTRTIVRVEPRLGGYFAEITHEFLIEPILEAIRDSWAGDPEYTRYRLALRTMERLQGDSLAGAKRLLSNQEFNILHQRREIVRWNNWSAELMLRSGIAYGVTKEVLSIWLKMFQTYEAAPFQVSPFASKDISIQKTESGLLSLAELRWINQHREDYQELSHEQVKLVWRSQITWATDEEREHVQYWTERMKANV
jgi:hypothetical protein